MTYDQRMQRICTTLAEAGYSVELVGRELPWSLPLDDRPFQQTRLQCHFRKGALFYGEYNLRLFVYLLGAPCDAVCSVDLDTLSAGCLATLLRRKKRVFDAHEYFTEVPEVTNRPFVKAIWAIVARVCLPFYRQAYTVGGALATIFEQKYGLPFALVRNMPLKEIILEKSDNKILKEHKIILYQGALNEGRGLEALIEAMQHLSDIELWLIGEGDRSHALRQQVSSLKLETKVRFWGFVKPDALKAFTQKAWIGVNLLENKGLSYYYSLANKFFDCVQALVPVVTMDFPEYRQLNAVHEVAILLEEANPAAITAAIKSLQNDPMHYKKLRDNAAKARLEWHWETEKTTLLACYRQLFSDSDQ